MSSPKTLAELAGMEPQLGPPYDRWLWNVRLRRCRLRRKVAFPGLAAWAKRI